VDIVLGARAVVSKRITRDIEIHNEMLLPYGIELSV
jgi:hypothetical protein